MDLKFGLNPVLRPAVPRHRQPIIPRQRQLIVQQIVKLLGKPPGTAVHGRRPNPTQLS